METATKKNRLKRVRNCNYLHGWLLCGAMVFSGFLPVSASETASQYEIEGTVLKITIPEGMTNEVDVSKVACANNNEITEIRKLGRGGFLMNDKTAIPNYTGDIHVKEGTWIVACTNALGKLSSNVDGSGVGGVFVTDGGTLEIGGTDPIIKNDGKKISIEGTGVDGNGALVITSTSGDVKNALGKNISLTGDATIGMMSKVNVYLFGATVALNGYKLTLAHNSSKTLVLNGTSNPCIIQSPGEIVLTDKSLLTFEGGTLMLGGEGKITFAADSRFKSNSMRGRYEWPMVWDSTGIISMTKQTTSDVVTNRNTWHGPVRLDKNMKVSVTGSGTFGLMGPVSGVGGLDLYYSTTPQPEIPTNFVNLANAGSIFTGGVSVRDLIVNVNENGAVPAEGGVFALTNSIANFDTPKNYALPDGVIHVDGDVERSISGGLGKWKTIVKTGTGTVNYDSSIGAEMLELREGVLKVSQQTVFAGLIEGVEYFTDMIDEQGNIVKKAVDISCNNAENDKIVYTNEVVMSPYLMNAEMKSYWTTHRPVWDTEKTIKAHCTTYSGYMWNRSSENVNWTFACNVANVAAFHFDGQMMFSHVGGSDKEIAKVTINVAPGAHSFRIGNHSKYFTKNGVPEDKTEGGMSGKSTAWKGMGFRWDPLGRDTTDPANFVILEDPGDGSLFTWAIPGEDVFYPGTEDLIEPAKFDLVKFTGGTLQLNGITNTITNVEGIPLVAGTGKLIIESKWTIDAADIADGSAVSGLSFGFGADAELEVENSAAAKSMTGSREWTVIKSAEDITGSITVKDEDMAKRWTVNIDGNEVKLKYRPFGTAVIIR